MQFLSQRKYAATIGVSHWAIGKAIRAGHIKRGFNKKTKKINVAIANKEWGNAAKEKHKGKLTIPEEKEALELSPLTIAFTNYCNALTALINAVEQESKRLQ